MPNFKESRINHIVSSLFVNRARAFSDLKNKVSEVEAHIREADSLKGSSAFGEVKKVALVEFRFEDLRLFVRKQVLHSDNYSCDELRAFPMERASIKDEERAASGSPRELNDND